MTGADRPADRGAGGLADRREDDVDRIVAAWERERPDLDLAPLHVLSRVTRLAFHLDRARREAYAGSGLETWEFDVLAALRRAGDPHELSPSALAVATLVTSGTMTNRIDRLAERELVERRPDPDDRRGVLVRLTDAGAHRVDAALADLLVRERAVLSVLPGPDADALACSLRLLLEPFEG